MKPKITFARWGNYTIAFKTLFESLGLEVIPPEKTTSETIAEGAKIAPEMFCFPLKVNLGNYLGAIKRGADTIFMTTALGGSCRLRYYSPVEEKTLREAGFNINFITFDQAPKDIYLKIKRISGASFWQILRAARLFFRKLRLIEKIEKMAQFYRPREIEKGITDRILQESFLKLDELKKEKDFPGLKKEILKKISEIQIEKNKNLPKVALIGEIYTTCDSEINFEVERKLGREGIEVHREMDLTYHLKKRIFPWKDWIIQRKIMPYLKSTVGGHGRDAIYEMLNYVKKDFDGIIHFLPFGCFTKNTNITIEGYLQKLIQDIKVGDKVLTHKGKFKKVTHKWCRNYQGPILKIDCGGKLLTISVTPEHPLLLAKATLRGGGRKEIQKPEFIPAHQAKKGDFVAIPIPKDMNSVDDPINFNTIEHKFPLEIKEKINKEEKIGQFVLNPNILRLLGYYLAEGTILYRWEGKKKLYPTGTGFCFNINERDYIKDVLKIIFKYFNLKGKINTKSSPNTAIVTTYNKSLSGFMEYLCGASRYKKKMSSELLNLDPPLEKEILKGFFRGDGSFRDKYRETAYRGVTASPNLASQLFWLLIRNRIKPSFMEQHIKNRKLSYMLKISTAREIKRLGDDKIKVTDRKPFIKHQELENYFLVPIRKMEWFNFKGKVYNLTVEKDHSYVANFLIAANCMPEVTVRPILEKIHQETGIPFLSLSFDEQVAEAGINTRLEAFVDVVRNYYESKK